MAHKKAAGSAKNLRDSNPKYRGLKLAGGQAARSGNIIVRQQGAKYKCGIGTYQGRDFTIHASTEGVVHFVNKPFIRFDGRRYTRTVVCVVTPEEYAAYQAEKANGGTPAQKPAKKAKKPAAKTKAPKKGEPVVEKKEAPKAVKEEKATEKKVATPKKDTEKKAESSAKADDLTKIEGIGPKIASIFVENGIKTYADLSGSKLDDLRTILADNKLSQHDPKTWKKQATLAKNGKRDELKTLQDELDGGK